MPASKAVWKFQLYLIDEPQSLDCGKILTVAEQNGSLCIWAENEPMTRQWFTVEGTGHPIPEGAKYVGTAHMHPLVWHVYRIPSPPAQEKK